MAYGNPTSNDDMYSDAAPAEEAESEEREEQGGEVYTLPKAVLEGKDFKPGDELVLKIDAIHDDRIEVSYAPAKDQESGEYEGGKSEAAPADGEMASMME